jgi:glycosyltransferase involved in cell wall biosynthesis
MRIHTCTPVAFGGGPDFFARDSGLLCRGLQGLGIESKAVMPGSRKPEDEADLIRTEFANLESAEWWESQELDGVVLYSWGRPKFRKVAAAIHDARIRLILNQDNGGVVSVLNGPGNWLSQLWLQTGQGSGPASWLRMAAGISRGLTLGLLLTDPLRRVHLRYGDCIACVSPKAQEHYKRLCGIYGGEKLRQKVVVVPHPVEGRFVYSGEGKRARVVCVGRWADQTQKRPRLLMEVMGRLLGEENIHAEIIGGLTPELELWHARLSKEIRERVILRGRLERGSLADVISGAQVFYSPSAHESFGIAAGEALCSGCSVVAARLVSMGSFEWFAAAGCGTLADTDDAAGHVAALKTELRKWRDGERIPERISGLWSGRLHEREVAKLVVRLVTDKRQDDNGR